MKMLTVIDRVLLLAAFSALFLASACGKNDAADDSTDVGAAPEVINEIELEPVTPTEQVELAYKYFLGEEKPQDYPRAAGLFLKAAKNGNSDAQFALGCMYQNGQGVQRNFMEAAKWGRLDQMLFCSAPLTICRTTPERRSTKTPWWKCLVKTTWAADFQMIPVISFFDTDFCWQNFSMTIILNFRQQKKCLKIDKLPVLEELQIF